MPHARDESLLSSGRTVLELARRLRRSAIHLERGLPTEQVPAMASDRALQPLAREAVIRADAGSLEGREPGFLLGFAPTGGLATGGLATGGPVRLDHPSATEARGTRVVVAKEAERSH